MNKLILKIDFSRLRKQEVKTLASRVINVVEGYNPETLKIKEIYDLLVELEPQIESLQLPYLPHPISKSIIAMRRQRIAFAQGIVDQLKAIEKGKISGMEESLEVAKPIVLQHLQGFRNYDDVKIYDNIILFSKIVVQDAELQTALSTLDLTSYYDNLRIVNRAIEDQFNARTKCISERPKRATPGIVAAIKKGLQDLFKEIEVSHVKYPELNYKPLIDELNKQIAIFKSTIKARASYSKKRADGVLNNNEVVIEDGSENPSETTQSTERMYPMDVEEGNGEISGQLDIKKTVAMPTKQTRLPDVSTEA